jgi:hypothetical protein
MVYFRFVEFMKNWTEKEMPDFMSVAFSSERSLEDELERQSEAEIVTVVISYAVMFVYIAVALGKFRSFQTLLVRHPGQSDRMTTVLRHHFRDDYLCLDSRDILSVRGLIPFYNIGFRRRFGAFLVPAPCRHRSPVLTLFE